MTADVGSPCIGLCQIDRRTGQCRGCHRTLGEITDWIGLDAAGKQRILDLLPTRRARHCSVVDPI
jgi:predicted Fe-S protein YdhL (DUF1289 family)